MFVASLDISDYSSIYFYPFLTGHDLISKYFDDQYLFGQKKIFSHKTNFWWSKHSIMRSSSVKNGYKLMLFIKFVYLF